MEFLLERMMGLSYDLDKDFREAFLAASEQYRSDRREDGYNPNFLMSLWRDRELTYKLSTDVPPELIRRIATNRSAVERFEAEIRWQEAQRLAESALSDGRTDFVGRDKKDYVIDNLLGACFPERSEIILYTRMIELAARDLGVEPDALQLGRTQRLVIHGYSLTNSDCEPRDLLLRKTKHDASIEICSMKDSDLIASDFRNLGFNNVTTKDDVTFETWAAEAAKA